MGDKTNVENNASCKKAGCTFKSIAENNYCKQHQRAHYIEETELLGLKICIGTDSACRSRLELTYKGKACPNCLSVKSKRDKARRDRAKVENRLLDNTKEKKCTACCRIFAIDQFESLGDRSVITSRCLKCRSSAIPKVVAVAVAVAVDVDVASENKESTNDLRFEVEPVSAVHGTSSEVDGGPNSARNRICAKRKCQTVLELSYELKTCLACLETDRKRDHARREKVKSDNELRSDTDDRACTACLKILPIDEFKKTDGTNGIASTCLSCKKSDRKQDAKRDPEKVKENRKRSDTKPERQAKKRKTKIENRERYNGYSVNYRNRQREKDLNAFNARNAKNAKQYRDEHLELKEGYNQKRLNSHQTQYKSCVVDYARANGIVQELTFDQYTAIVNKPCYYCADMYDRGTEQFNGIERENESIGYIVGNCRSRCKMCLTMQTKGSSRSHFLLRVEHILTVFGIIDGSLRPEEFKDHRPVYRSCKASAEKRGKDFLITSDEFHTVTAQECYLCGKPNTHTHSNGIDRFDNTIGYLFENCRSCCGDCNYMKGDYSFFDILEKCKQIHANHNCVDIDA